MSSTGVATPRGTPETQFRVLFDREYEPMVQLAFRLVRNRGDAEEVVQDALAEVYRRWDGLLNPGGYLRTTTINGARRVVQRRARGDALRARLRPAGPHQEDSTPYLLDVLERLPERERTALVLAYYADMTRAEIAETLGCRPGTAKSLVHRGLKRLKAELTHD